MWPHGHSPQDSGGNALTRAYITVTDGLDRSAHEVQTVNLIVGSDDLAKLSAIQRLHGVGQGKAIALAIGHYWESVRSIAREAA